MGYWTVSTNTTDENDVPMMVVDDLVGILLDIGKE